MLKRKLGSQGLEVPAIGLGCMGMTIQYGELDDEKSTNINDNNKAELIKKKK